MKDESLSIVLALISYLIHLAVIVLSVSYF